MYKMLIVDDNEWDRIGIQKVLDWEGMGIGISGVCANGKQALECVELDKPDIVLSDIAMPVMNGVEMAEILNARYPEVKIIFMSCYNDFAFAKSAIYLDVQDYVLKPIVKEDLKKSILKVLNKSEAEYTRIREKEEMQRHLKQSLPVLREQFFRELLLGLLKEAADIDERLEFLELSQLQRSTIHVVSLEISEYGKRTERMGADDKYYTSYSIHKIIESQLREGYGIQTVQVSPQEFALIIFEPTEPPEDPSSELMEILLGIEDEIGSRLSMDTLLGVSKGVNRIEELPLLYRQASEAVNSSLYSSCNKLVLYSEIEAAQQGLFEETVDLQELYKELKNLLSHGSEEEIRQFAGRYLKMSEAAGGQNFLKSLAFTVTSMIQVLLLETGDTYRDIFGDELMVWNKLARFTTIGDIGQWLFNMLKGIRDFLQGKNKTQDQKITGNIKEVIQKRYHEPLTVGDILEGIYISSGYANSIFKKVTGRTIFDYLTEYRMEEAKRLLKDAGSKIYLVAEQVGYTNIGHFRLVFKKFTGLSPAEFKEKSVI